MPRRNPSGQDRTRKGSSGRSSSKSRTGRSDKKNFSGKRDGEPKRFDSKPGRKTGFRKGSGGSDKGSGSERESRFKKDSRSGEGPNTGPRSKSGYGSFRDKGSSGNSASNRASREDQHKRFDSKPGRKTSFKKDSGNFERGSDFSKGSRFNKDSRSSGESGENKGKRPSRNYGSIGDSGSSSHSGAPKRSYKQKTSFSGRADKGDQRRENSSAKGGGFNKPKFSSSKKEGSIKPKRGERPGPSESKNARFNQEAPIQTDKIRLNRYIANSGVCSRREADELITMGVISVNGKTITELGYKVNPGDEVRYEKRLLKAEKPVYILMNKPKGFLTTTKDPQERNTVMHLIGSKVKERIYPVGRLDRNTTGLLLLTNDGELAEKLMHPSYNVKKIYKVDLDRPLNKGDLQKIQEGVQLEEGKAIVDDIAIVSADGKTVGVEIHIGWNRVVRRIFEALEYAVIKLDRSVYAGLDKKELSRGEWRYLSQEEIVRLKHFQ